MKVNGIVLRHENLALHNEWWLNRIMDVYPGSDCRLRKLKLIVCDIIFDKGNKPISRRVCLERPVHGVVTLLEVE